MSYARLCKDCDNFIAKRLECSLHHTTSLVTGQEIYTNAHLVRDSISLCGPNGNWFEPVKEDADLDDLSTIPFGK